MTLEIPWPGRGKNQGDPGLAVRLSVSDAIGDTVIDWGREIDDLVVRLSEVAGWQLAGDSINLDRQGFATILSFRIKDSTSFVATLKTLLDASPMRAAVSVWIEDHAGDMSTWHEVDLGFSPPTGS